MFVTNWISTTKIQKISEITNFFRHYFLSRTEVNDWIRSQAKKADGILDFAKLLQDPNDDRRMKREYASND